jgi:hypothetical protein
MVFQTAALALRGRVVPQEVLNQEMLNQTRGAEFGALHPDAAAILNEHQFNAATANIHQ